MLLVIHKQELDCDSGPPFLKKARTSHLPDKTTSEGAMRGRGAQKPSFGSTVSLTRDLQVVRDSNGPAESVDSRLFFTNTLFIEPQWLSLIGGTRCGIR
jgi:hypothetical protein